MPNPIQRAIESRVSVNYYDPDRTLSDDVIQSLVAQATRAPSAYNFQNWRFIAVRSAHTPPILVCSATKRYVRLRWRR